MVRIRRTRDHFSALRIYVLMALMLCAFLVLSGSLWSLQVSRISQFKDRQQMQSLRRVRLPGIRGKIYDRNEFCLADNRPTYSIALFPEEIRVAGSFSKTVDRAVEVMNKVAEITGLEPVLDRDDIRKHIDWYRPYPLVLWREVGPVAIARLAEKGIDLPAVDVYTKATRSYPYPSTSHLIGYARENDPDPESKKQYSYSLPEITGDAGLEKLFDPFLRGMAGAKLVQVDVGIYRHGEFAVLPPKAGGDLRLTLDMEVQLLAHKAMSTNRGAVVVLDPNNGDVLAMLSSPGYDANLFEPFITTADFKNLNEDPSKPLFNRAVLGTYPPGSTFKPLVALAASTVNPQAIHTVYDSPGTFVVGRRVVNTRGHGRVSMREALKYSANVYFFKTALENGWEPIIEQAQAIGLGSKTGVEVDYEAAGVVPDAAWRKKKNIGGWTDGDTINLAIGQGALTVTPLQLAMMTATVANGGILYRPRLVQAYREPGSERYLPAPERRVGKMNWSAEALEVVRGGMRDVIMSRDGTGRKAAVKGFDFAGKTGTAEYGRRGEGKKHTWMIAFAPFDNPQYAIAFLIEDGDSGGSTVGPRLKVLMQWLYEKMKREGRLSNAQRSILNDQYSVFQPLEIERCSLNIEHSVAKQRCS